MSALLPILKTRQAYWVIALCIVSLAVMASPGRYRAVSGAADLAGDSGQWVGAAQFRDGVRIDDADERAVLRVDAEPRAPGHFAAYVLPALPDAGAIRAEIEVRADKIEHGTRPWQYAEVALWGFDRTGKSLWYWPKRIVTVDGSYGWTWHSVDIPLGGSVDRMVLIARNASLSGEVALRGLRLRPVELRPAMLISMYVLLAAWVLVIAWIATGLLRRRGLAAGKVLLVGVSVVALAGVLTPQPQFSRAAAPLEDSLRTYNPLTASTADQAADRLTATPDAAPRPGAAPDAGNRGNLMIDSPPRMPSDLAADSPISFKELGHFLCFAALAFAAWLSFPATPVRALAAYLGLALLTSEVLQLFVITRSSSWFDLVIDGLGVLTGLAIAGLFRLIVTRAFGPTWLARAEAP